MKNTFRVNSFFFLPTISLNFQFISFFFPVSQRSFLNSVLLKIVRILFLFLGCHILDFMDKLRCTSFSLFCSVFHAGEFCQMLVGHLLAVKKVFEVVRACGEWERVRAASLIK